MICVSIGRGRHKHMIAEHKHLVEQGAKLVELRLDYINGEINLKRVLPDRPGPVVVTIRRPADGGKFSGSEEERRILLRVPSSAAPNMSTWKRMPRRPFPATARPNASSACTTSARRPTISSRSTPGWRLWMPTS